MYQSVALLGRQSGIAIAELESLVGSENVHPFSRDACFVDVDACAIPFDRMGGSIRIGTVLLELPSTNWFNIEKLMIDAAPHQAAKVDGKLSFGISVYGVKASPKQIEKTALSMKKAIKASGKSVRVVPHKSNPLNSATVIHNNLHSSGNWELLVISDGKKAYLAQTNFIQDIDAYAARDQARPKRDAKVGMLPPKLAQIIINLASGAEHKSSRNEKHSKVVLDPFCGTGVLLQEAMLMDYGQYGTDIEPRMIEYTKDNLAWASRRFNKPVDGYFDVADATTATWRDQAFNLVACETFLGKPLSTLPPTDQLSKIMFEANYVNHKFLQNIAAQLKSGSRMCIAVPTWRGKKEFLHLPALDHLTEMGYNRLKFKHVSNEDLIYHREGQVVGRELLVLIKN